MTPTRRNALALALILGAAPRPATAAGIQVHREELPGGLELLVLPIADARSASLRYVVRAGSAQDPPLKEGLAHVVEHLIFHRRPGATGVLDDARLVGATVNAFTSRDATVFVLDAAREPFPALAEGLLRAITDPPLDTANVDRELDVIRNEADLRRDVTIIRLVEESLFRASAAESGPIGEHRSRELIRRDDAIAFYQRNYVTSSTTVVFAGAVTPESARAIVDRAFLLPPALPSERVPPRGDEPRLPVDEHLAAGFLAGVHGYRLDAGDRAVCEPLAAQVELRLRLRLEIQEPLLSEVQAVCLDLRGSPFLLAMGFAPNLEATDLPQQLEAVFAEVARGGPTARERPLLAKRLQRKLDRTAWEPPELAGASASEAMRMRDGGTTSFDIFEQPKKLPEREMRATARRAFVPARAVKLFLSPFQE